MSERTKTYKGYVSGGQIDLGYSPGVIGDSDRNNYYDTEAHIHIPPPGTPAVGTLVTETGSSGQLVLRVVPGGYWNLNYYTVKVMPARPCLRVQARRNGCPFINRNGSVCGRKRRRGCTHCGRHGSAGGSKKHRKGGKP